MRWERIIIKNDEGGAVEAMAPIVISASRATDIPAFYPDWLCSRMEKGFLEWNNPFNNVKHYVSFSKCRAMVFWTKNPRPMFKYLDYLDKKIGNYYFHYTLNDYENDCLEPNLPPLRERIASFVELSDRIGKDRVIWRFDPLILTDNIDIDSLLRRIEYIGTRVKDRTNKLIFSFADIDVYKKVEKRLKKEGVRYHDFTLEDKIRIAKGISSINNRLGLEVATCSEDIDLEGCGVKHARCIDPELMSKIFNHDYRLMDYLKRCKKDSGQRKDCRCISSKDIGKYGTCKHGCKYCYAQ
ncbi:MAG: DUF1848 domain-containing protein [Candidatus Pacebacteria bacterium]|nr:DUF1848 domain-containing protein [Candidatus Paceibacterota bacterium]